MKTKEITKELCLFISDAIEIFKNKHPEFFEKKGFSSIIANSLYMVTACYIEKELQDDKVSMKLKMLEDIFNIIKNIET